MNGSGCKNCPVNPCETMTYRGSACVAQRAKFGLCDPQTHADQIRAMSDEELAKLIYGVDGLGWCKSLPECIKQIGLIPEEKCIGCALEWLRQPVEVSDNATA